MPHCQVWSTASTPVVFTPSIQRVINSAKPAVLNYYRYLGTAIRLLNQLVAADLAEPIWQRILTA